jgi:hypothetical protein
VTNLVTLDTEQTITGNKDFTGKLTINGVDVATKEDDSKLVTLDTDQNITGTKVFTEQIGILNGPEGEINYIKHINNNFLISSSDGENIINIDEQLKTFNFYNKPLAKEEYVSDNYISYTTQQTLTEAQKQIARNNIGAGTGGGASVDLSNYVTLNGDQTITGEKTINAPLEINSTSQDYSNTSHMTINPTTIQLMYQDTNGNEGSLVITPTAGVQISTTGSTITLSENKINMVADNGAYRESINFEPRELSIAAKNLTQDHESKIIVGEDDLSIMARQGEYWSEISMLMDWLSMFAGTWDVYLEDRTITTDTGNIVVRSPVSMHAGWTGKNGEFYVEAKATNKIKSKLRLDAYGVYLNDNELATKADIATAITTTLNTAV